MKTKRIQRDYNLEQAGRQPHIFLKEQTCLYRKARNCCVYSKGWPEPYIYSVYTVFLAGK
jgi:hypothetical protein